MRILRYLCAVLVVLLCSLEASAYTMEVRARDTSIAPYLTDSYGGQELQAPERTVDTLHAWAFAGGHSVSAGAYRNDSGVNRAASRARVEDMELVFEDNDRLRAAMEPGSDELEVVVWFGHQWVSTVTPTADLWKQAVLTLDASVGAHCGASGDTRAAHFSETNGSVSHTIDLSGFLVDAGSFVGIPVTLRPDDPDGLMVTTYLSASAKALAPGGEAGGSVTLWFGGVTTGEAWSPGGSEPAVDYRLLPEQVTLPEPATMSLLTLGGLAGLLRRRVGV